MLPNDYYKAEHLQGAYSDKNFIAEQLDLIKPNQRRKACEHYSKIYLEEGRQAANNRLRKYVNTCLSVNNGCVTKLAAL